MRPTRNSKETAAAVIIFLFAGLSAAYAAAGFFGVGFFGKLADLRTKTMFCETGLLFLWLFLSGRFVQDRMARNVLCLLGASGFLFLHRIFLPVIIAGLYCGMLILTGEVVLVPLRKREGRTASAGCTRAAHDFLTGSSLYMIFLCALSAAGLGSIRLIRVLTAALFLTVLVLFLLLDSARQLPVCYVLLPPERGKMQPEKEQGPRTEHMLLLSLTAVMVLLQAGRLNISLDYDSLHYGLRSQYILNNGRGIYENLGLVNDVYFYPKGIELLTMPLSGTPTYGFVLAFSLWMAVFCLAMIYTAVRRIAGRRAGTAAAFLASFIPGIMNMGASAKSDIGTLLVQLIMINETVRFLRNDADEGRGNSVLWLAAAFLLSLTMKPTALVFSTLILLTAAVFLLRAGRRPQLSGRSAAQILLPPVLALAGVTARTVLLTGYPVASVFTSVWKRLGMHGKYPLAGQALPSAQAGLPFAKALTQWLLRLRALLFLPAGQYNRHILIAWGTVLFPTLLLACVLLGIMRHADCGKRTADGAGNVPDGKENLPGPGSSTPDSAEKTAAGKHAAVRFLSVLLAVLLLTDALTLVFLFQVDGNYYMLTYGTAVITATVLIGRGKTGRFCLLVSPALLLSLVMTGLTCWSGSAGFTPVSFCHYGFYDHASDIRDAFAGKGAADIYGYLEGRPRSRVLAFAGEPACYALPCCTESYADVEGSGGNVRLVKTLNVFRDYLEYAGTEYIYTEDAFLSGHERAADIIRWLKKEGSIREIMNHGGNVLYEYRAGIRD